MASSPQTIPIIRTRLHRPSATAGLVCRGELHAGRDAERHLRLMLVAAPARNDNRAAMTQGLEEELVPSTWASLVEGNGDPRGFPICLVTQSLYPKACRHTAMWTDASQLPKIVTLSGSSGENTQ